MFDGFLSTNSFDEPTIVKDINAAQVAIIRLLLLEKNTIQSHPDMGIGLITRWRYGDTLDLGKLATEIQDQIDLYLPSLAGSTVDLVPQERDLYIKVLHQNVVYGFKLDNDAGSLAPLY